MFGILCFPFQLRNLFLGLSVQSKKAELWKRICFCELRSMNLSVLSLLVCFVSCWTYRIFFWRRLRKTEGASVPPWKQPPGGGCSCKALLSPWDVTEDLITGMSPLELDRRTHSPPSPRSDFASLPGERKRRTDCNTSGFCQVKWLR